MRLRICVLSVGLGEEKQENTVLLENRAEISLNNGDVTIKENSAYIINDTGEKTSNTISVAEQLEVCLLYTSGVSLGRLKHWFNGTEYCIDDFCIRSSCQGKGAGSLFLKMLRAYGRKKNYKKITLRTKRTASAYEFYKKNGFREIEEDVFFSMECNI